MPRRHRPLPVFIGVIFLLFFLFNAVSWVLMERLLGILNASDGWRLLGGCFFVAQAVGLAMLLGAPFFGRQPGTGMGRFFLSLVFIWNLLLLPILMAFWSLQATVAWLTGARAALWAGPIATGLFATAAMVLAGLAAWQLERFRVRRLELEVPGLAPELDGFTIAHLSDLHVGRLTRGAVLEAMTREANALQADLAVVTGDLINFALSDFPAAVKAIRAIRARYGVWLCEGNHDLMEGRDAFEGAARASGLGFLFDEQVSFVARGTPVQLLGLRWGSDPEALFALRRPDSFPILLAHHPHAFDAAAAAGIPLTLSGHTHGGQLRLTRRIGFGPLFYRYWEGIYRRGKSVLVVSGGTGNWFPLRWNTPAEIVHLTLRRTLASLPERS